MLMPSLLFLSVSSLVLHTCGAFTPSNRDDLKVAVDEWTDNAAAANATYGDIANWDTSLVGDMSYVSPQFGRMLAMPHAAV